MSILARYEEINNVTQREEMTGCIPWAIEWMIRYKGVVANNWKIPQGELSFFQDIYDLQLQNMGTNSFSTIKDAIEEDYGNIRLRLRPYQSSEGQQKFQYIERLLGRGAPCIMSIKLSPQIDAHVMPIIEVNPVYIRVIWKITNTGQQDIWTFPRSCLVWMTSQGLSGNDILFLQ